MKDDHPQWSDDDAAAAFERVQKERYAADVFDWLSENVLYSRVILGGIVGGIYNRNVWKNWVIGG